MEFKEDNIVYFRHLIYPTEIIKFPRYVVTITNKNTKAKYIYGCFVIPTDSELLYKIMPHRVWENEECGVFEYKGTNYTITIEKIKQCR